MCLFLRELSNPLGGGPRRVLFRAESTGARFAATCAGTSCRAEWQISSATIQSQLSSIERTQSQQRMLRQFQEPPTGRKSLGQPVVNFADT
mmetsp:Transcript_48101/g.127352  ORF Transcript_48101/g.127352 Transcript_48101/m.127352 type:complete len:91 (-) Transcript_48101:840-1112(-)